MPSLLPSSKRPRIDWSSTRDRIDIVRVARSLLGEPIKHQGRRLLWRCPFHDDHDPTFQLDPDRDGWKRWPCNLGGDSIDLVKRVENLALKQA